MSEPILAIEGTPPEERVRFQELSEFELNDMIL